MAQSLGRGSFSFELSDSAPPVEAEDGTPLGDLEIDLAAFGTTEDGGSNLVSTDGAPLLPRVADSPFSPLPPVSVHSLPADDDRSGEPPGSLSEVLSAQPSLLGASRAALSDPLSIHDLPTPAMLPSTTSMADQASDLRSPTKARIGEVRTREARVGEARAVAQLHSEMAHPKIPPSVPLLAQPAVTGSAAPGRAQPPRQPHIKRIHFPPSVHPPGAPATSETTVKNSKVAGAPAVSELSDHSKVSSSKHASQSKPATRFASSIGRRPVQTDSEPPPPRDQMDRELESGCDALDEPSDLPSESTALAAPRLDDWGTETPTARELWKAARKAWHKTQSQAKQVGGLGLRASARLAHSMNHQVQSGFREVARRRAARGEHQDDTARSSLPDQTQQSHQGQAESGAPSPVGLLIWGLARRTGRKLAAPLSAALAAGAFYALGSHFLAERGPVALSRVVAAPEVPYLGTLDEPRGATGMTSQKGSGSASAQVAPGSSPSPSSAGKMVTETAPLPDGLSWPGKGLIEVVTSEDELIYVDGVFIGRGPLRRIPVSSGTHEITIKSGGNVRGGTVEVNLDKTTRAVFKSVP